MSKFTPDDLDELATYKAAIDLIFDYGKWERIGGELVWVIQEKYADKVQQMIGELEE